MPNDLAKKILSDIRIELLDEFGRNFERKAFFDQQWENRKRSGKGSLLLVSGRLRRSIRAHQTSKYSIRFSSDSEYADIHNSGGVIPVTPKMRGYFWHSYKQAKDPEASIPAKGSDAEFWHRMARAQKITIPKRQFIGGHPVIDKCVKDIANECTKKHVEDLFDKFAKKASNI